MSGAWLTPLSKSLRTILVFLAVMTPWSIARGSEVQNPVDRADPSVIGEELRQGADQDPERRRPDTGPVIGDSAPGNGTASFRAFTVGAVRVEGAAILPRTAFTSAIEPYLGQELDEPALRALARDVAEVAREAGYGLATAWVPPQDIRNGILRVRLEEGRIDSVEATGPAARVAESGLAPLADGRPVRTSELERRLRLVGDVPGVTLGPARLIRRGERNVLVVDTAFARASAQAWIDNWGTESVGPVRLRMSGDFNGLAMAGDRLTVGGVMTPFQPGEFQLGHARYALPLGSDGTELAVRGYLGRTDAGAELRKLDLDGNSYEVSVAATHPLLRSRAASLWGTIDLTLRDSELSRRDSRIRNDRIVAASASLYGTKRAGRGQLRVRLDLVQGLDILGATERGDPLASRRDGGGPFTKFAFWTDYYRPLGGGFSLLVRAEGQIASRPLLSSEEMGLGGQAFLRAYDYRERAGDRGAAAAAELRFDLRGLPRPVRYAQIYLYADAGRVTNRGTSRGGGTLASTGGGLRFWARGGWEVGLELGVPLRDGFFGRRPDPRFSFIAGVRF